jgi:hypothetical protein
MQLNTSMLGQNILKNDDNSASSSNDTSDGDDSIFDKFKHKVHDIGSDVKGKIGDITGDIIEDIAGELGISDWYSIHIMNACQGEFGANATTTHFMLNVTNCTQSAPASKQENYNHVVLLSG